MTNRSGIIRHRPSLAGALLALLVVAGPWFFGGIAPFSVLVPILGAGALLFALGLEWRTPQRLGRALGLAAGPAGALAGLGLLGLGQALPLPAGMTAGLSPQRAELGRDAAASLGSELGALPLSLSPPASVATALLLLGLAAVFLATLTVARERVDRRLLLGSVLAVAVAQVIFGAPRWVSRATTLSGLTLPGDATRLRGSYVNANHLALLLLLGLTLAFAWGAWAARRASQEPSLERRLTVLAPPVGLWLALFAGLAFTESRAGLAAAIAGTVVQTFCLGLDRRWRWLGLGAVLALLVVGLGIAVWLGGGAGFERLAGTSAYDLTLNSRRVVYASTFDLWLRFPFFGSGLGSFRDAFPLVQPAHLPGSWTHAHNDPLELLATAGLLGVTLLGLGLWRVVQRLRKVMTTGRRSEDRFGALAALGALAAVGVHEGLDFGLTLSANAVALTVLVAAAAAARCQPPPEPPP
ncbi:MAG: O-antigen ligase family protein [Thermoanaerobaculia bacterium]|nr:O-antigen ligase family protein [Thermoanaerobaculia bacterium]